MLSANIFQSALARLGFSRDGFIAAALRALPVFDRLLMWSAATEPYQVFPNSTFGWTGFLEASTPAIRAEAEALLRDRMSVPSVREISPDHAKIAVDDKWRSFFLWGYGVRIDANCARCPQTTKILENIPGLLTAFYSVMLAGAHVPRHTGPTKAILTTHLGLIVPKEREKCHMDVNGQDVVWQEGRVVIFDDMYPHEVWNDTSEDRIILLLHIKRPLKFPGSMLRDLFFAGLRASPFVRDGLRNLERWDRKTPAPVAN
ncbi:MAG TPA: aspartyl/asparaginyl beta-hydroxylase domain-containing protein [Rhizomicrobium sp.]|nr:aspartyl/asparaginyl beta-hydroxylase domain-containing protein [Rhizomicrobium sp.]